MSCVAFSHDPHIVYLRLPVEARAASRLGRDLQAFRLYNWLAVRLFVAWVMGPVLLQLFHFIDQ